MFLPKTSEYALRCMAQIAVLPWETSISAEELHKLVDVPRDYMSKVLRKLASAGLLRVEKGRSGGFRLSSPPSQISFLQILEASGFSFERDHCISGWSKCNASDPCPLHDTFTKLSRDVYAWASNTTLADVNKTETYLRRLQQRSTTERRV